VEQRGDAWRGGRHAVRMPVQKDAFQGRQVIEDLLRQSEVHGSRWKWSNRTHGHNDPSLALRRRPRVEDPRPPDALMERTTNTTPITTDAWQPLRTPSFARCIEPMYYRERRKVPLKCAFFQEQCLVFPRDIVFVRRCSLTEKKGFERAPLSNLAERGTDFGPKGWKSARMLGIGGSSPARSLPRRIPPATPCKFVFPNARLVRT